MHTGLVAIAQLLLAIGGGRVGGGRRRRRGAGSVLVVIAGRRGAGRQVAGAERQLGHQIDGWTRRHRIASIYFILLMTRQTQI